jgi:hypothetical protein
MAGEALGSMLFGLLGIVAAFALVRRLEAERGGRPSEPALTPTVGSLPVNPEPPL